MKRNLTVWALQLLLASAAGTSAIAAPHIPKGEGGQNARTSKPSESELYMDLNDGKVFRVFYDGLNEIYNRSDLFPLDLYVNVRTKDTFWLAEGVMVNNALLQDAQGNFKVDPSKVKRKGSGYIINTSVVVNKAKPQGKKESPSLPAGPAAALSSQPLATTPETKVQPETK
jgi:hypothetical protein